MLSVNVAILIEIVGTLFLRRQKGRTLMIGHFEIRFEPFVFVSRSISISVSAFVYHHPHSHHDYVVNKFNNISFTLDFSTIPLGTFS